MSENKLRLHDYTALPPAPASPKNLVFCIRGTNGSGKSYLMNQLINYLGTPLRNFKEGPIGVAEYKDAFVVGAYNSACGGLDTVKDFYSIAPLVRRLAQEKHVLIEGLLWSGIFGASYNLTEELRADGNDMIWLMLTTTSAQCIANVGKRRVEVMDKRPLNTSALIAKYKSCCRIQKAAYRVGATCYSGDATTLLRTIQMGLLDGLLRGEKEYETMVDDTHLAPEEYRDHIALIEEKESKAVENSPLGAFLL